MEVKITLSKTIQVNRVFTYVFCHSLISDIGEMDIPLSVSCVRLVSSTVKMISNSLEILKVFKTCLEVTEALIRAVK